MIRLGILAIVLGFAGFGFTVGPDAEQGIDQNAASYIGTVYTRLPEQSFGGWYVSDYGGLCFCVAHVVAAGKEMLWLEVTSLPVRPDSVRRVVDVLELSSNDEAKGLKFEYCDFRPPRGRAAAALAQPGARKEVRAWTVDFEKQRFVELAPADGTCSFMLPGD
jgi:hypothetical protein